MSATHHLYQPYSAPLPDQVLQSNPNCNSPQQVCSFYHCTYSIWDRERQQLNTKYCLKKQDLCFAPLMYISV